MSYVATPYQRRRYETAEQRDEAVLRAATANAPTWVLRSINADRRRRGHPELRGGRFDELQRPRQVREQGLGTLAGLATYGPSTPTSCEWDKRKLVEFFAPNAFAESVEEIRHGLRSAWLSLGHNVDELASTSDDTLGFFVHPVVGLQFWAKLNTSDEHRKICTLARAGKLGVSVGFVDADFESRPYRKGERCRVITKARLHHVALLDRNKAVPCYRAAKVEHVFGRDVKSICDALYVARLDSKLAALELKSRRF